jgi:hypothetical protein
MMEEIALEELENSHLNKPKGIHRLVDTIRFANFRERNLRKFSTEMCRLNRLRMMWDMEFVGVRIQDSKIVLLKGEIAGRQAYFDLLAKQQREYEEEKLARITKCKAEIKAESKWQKFLEDLFN